jgi:hypothetical protein
MSQTQPKKHNFKPSCISSNTSKSKIILGFSIFTFIFSISGCGCNKEAPPETYHTVFEKTIKEKFSFVNIKSFSESEIKSKEYKVFGNPDFLYLITPESKEDSKTPIYLFDKNEYARDFGSDFKFKLEEICEKTKKVRDEISDYGKWVKSFKEQADFLKRLSLKVKIDTHIVKPEIGTDLKAIDEMINFVRLSKELPGKARIVVRGFADVCIDGSVDCKIGKLIKNDGKSRNYEYLNIKGHKLNRPGDNAELRGYKLGEELLKTSNKDGEYTNEHLPNLRAFF